MSLRCEEIEINLKTCCPIVQTKIVYETMSDRIHNRHRRRRQRQKEQLCI